ncbi:MAG: alpha/beta hydrolase [Chloroflexota bacterium]|nr:alpha/beta hydrolase [Chloroflexota bacterium]
MPQPLIELAGDLGAPTLHLAPANGFPPQTYLPMLRLLRGYRCVCLPPRALWGDQKPPSEYRDWRSEADDLLSGLNRHDLRKVIAVGHSLGGVVSMLALLKAPERFNALVMLDPPILLPDLLEMIRLAWEENLVEHIPMVQMARRRRQIFESEAAAFARFRGKRVFADWADESLWLYVEHGLRRRAAGDGFELIWSIDWEAHYFATVYQDIWADLPKLNGLAPSLFIRGEDSDTFSREAYHLAQALAPKADFQLMPGRGHLFPLAAPAQTARLVTDWLGAL